MTEPTLPTQSPPAKPGGDRQLEDYLDRNIGKYTDEALTASARAAGYTDEAIQAGLARIRASGSSEPVRARARQIILWAYLATFLVLSAGMVVNSGGSVAIGAPILGISLLIGFAISRLMVRAASRSAALGIILAGPVIILLVVAGLCVATGLPVRSLVL